MLKLMRRGTCYQGMFQAKVTGYGEAQNSKKPSITEQKKKKRGESGREKSEEVVISPC